MVLLQHYESNIRPLQSTLRLGAYVISTHHSKIYNVSDWTDIVDIAVTAYNVVGLRSDGTVVATGKNDKGQCNVSDWKDIVDIAAGYGYTVGLRKDGTVVATGDNERGQCNVSDWKGIIDVVCGQDTIGLRSNGTVVTTGENQYEVSEWTDVIAIAPGPIGLRSDGTVGATGENQYEVSEWNDVIEIAYGPIGLRSDGTVVATGAVQSDVLEWKLIVTDDDCEKMYSDGIQLMEMSTVESLVQAMGLFNSLPNYKDSSELAEQIQAQLFSLRQKINEEEERRVTVESLEKERVIVIHELKKFESNPLLLLRNSQRKKHLEAKLKRIDRDLRELDID